jgi:hypothetical protein
MQYNCPFCNENLKAGMKYQSYSEYGDGESSEDGDGESNEDCDGEYSEDYDGKSRVKMNFDILLLK